MQAEFVKMQNYFIELEKRHPTPEMVKLTDNFLYTPEFEIFAADIELSETYAALIAADDDEREIETRNLAGKFMEESGCIEILTTQDIIKITDYVQYWGEQFSTYEYNDNED